METANLFQIQGTYSNSTTKISPDVAKMERQQSMTSLMPQGILTRTLFDVSNQNFQFSNEKQSQKKWKRFVFDEECNNLNDLHCMKHKLCINLFISRQFLKSQKPEGIRNKIWN